MTQEKTPNRGTKGRIRFFGKKIRKGADLVDYGMKNDRYSDEDLLRLALAVEEAAKEFRASVEDRYLGVRNRPTVNETLIFRADELLEGDQVFETRFLGGDRMIVEPLYRVLAHAERLPDEQVRLRVRLEDGTEKIILTAAANRVRVLGR